MNRVVWLRVECAKGIASSIDNIANFLLGGISQLKVHTVGTCAKFAFQKFFDLHNGHGQVEADFSETHLHMRMRRV